MGPTPPFLVSKTNIFTQNLQKRCYQTTVVVLFRETYAPTSRNYVSTDAKRR